MPTWVTPPLPIPGTLITAEWGTYVRDSLLGASKTLYMVSSNGVNQGPGTTKYYGMQGDGTTENNVYDVLAVAKTVQNLRMYLPGSPGVGESIVATVRKNEADTPLVVSLTNLQTNGEDTVNTVAFDANDRISIKVVSSGSANARQPKLCCELV